MISAEFGIIDDFEAFNKQKDYLKYDPEKYHCVAIDDEMYLNDWWESLSKIDTFNVSSNHILQSQKSLSRWGITIIPPSSLPSFINIVVSDKRYAIDKSLAVLSLYPQSDKRGKVYNTLWSMTPIL